MVQRRKRQIDPKTFKKHSSVVRKQEKESFRNFIVKGDRQETKLGYKVLGYTGKFENYFEVMLPKTSTNVYCHPTKVRTYRVLAGGGSVMKHEEVVVDGETKVNSSVTTISPGDELVIPSGTSFRILAADFGLEVFVSQEEKYDSRLKVIAETETGADVPRELLKAPTEKEIMKATTAAQGIRARRGSKAAMQQVVAQNATPVREVTPLERMPEAASVGVNARPTMGNFKD